MAKKIAIGLRKGGSGKTTTAVNLATALHKKGKKTLLAKVIIGGMVLTVIVMGIVDPVSNWARYASRVFAFASMALILAILPYLFLRKVFRNPKTVVFGACFILIGILSTVGNFYKSSQDQAGTVLETAEIKEVAIDKSEDNSELIGNMYRNNKYGFRIKFPEGWEIKVGDGKHIVQKAVKGNATVSVMVQQVDLGGNEGIKDITEALTLDEFIETSTQGVKDKFSDFKVLDKGETKIDNMPAYWVEYSGSSQVLDIKASVTIRAFMFAKNDTFYTIQAGTATNEYKATQPELMKSVATFVLEN